ncbi:MAG: branched-chain amino acid ABC transporter permease [bacterium]|nr:branched-chain amino acid ABC transporter permease [bacterium]
MLKSLFWTFWLWIIALPFAGPIKSIYIASVVFILSFLRFIKFPAKISSFKDNWDDFLSKANEKIPYGYLIVRILFILSLIIIPMFLDRRTNNILVDCGIYALLALGLNIAVGFAGLLVLGYIAFYAIGAYTYALLSVHFHIPFSICVPISAGMAIIFGILLGLPVLRLRGDYLAIVTLGFGEITRIVLNNWDSVTNGPNGILGIARPSIGSFVFHSPKNYYYLILAFLFVAVFVFNRLNNSRLGRAWVAIKEDERAAKAMGINCMSLKLLAFAISAAFAGVAGAFFGAKATHVSPESFTFFESALVLCMVVLGGMGSIPGAILGASCLIIIPEIFRDYFGNSRMLLFGIVMIAMMRFKPEGLLPYKRRNL